MYPALITRGAMALRTVRPLFSRFAAPGSRLAQTQGSTWGNFIKSVAKSPKLKWFFGIVRDAAVFSAVAAGIDWAVDWMSGEEKGGSKTAGGQESITVENSFRNIMINDLVALVLDTQGYADVESQAVILDNYALTCLSSGDSNLTLEGIATAGAAEYIRRTKNNSYIYDLGDALNILHQFEEQLDGKDEFTDLSEKEISELTDAIDELEKGIGSNDVSRLADLMAFQASFIKNLQQ